MASTRVPRFPAAPASNTILLDDHRFHDLLPDEEWGRLPLAIWRRFSKRVADGATLDDVLPEAFAIVREAGTHSPVADIVHTPRPLAHPHKSCSRKNRAPGSHKCSSETRRCCRAPGFLREPELARRIRHAAGNRRKNRGWKCCPSSQRLPCSRFRLSTRQACHPCPPTSTGPCRQIGRLRRKERFPPFPACSQFRE